jgi:hypothetical protein
MRKNLPIILLGIVLLAVVGVSCYTNPQAAAGPPSVARLFAWPSGVETLAVLFTLFFIAWQALLMRQSVAGAEDSSKRELRAYLTVVVGEATFQERRPADKGGNLMFGCRPLVVNTGRTPARNIIFKARAAIMPFPLPKETHLPEATDKSVEGNVLGPQQQANMFSVVEGYRSDQESEQIKHGIGDMGLYTWGLVTYEDVFGETHFTRFCQRTYWDLSDRVRCHYIPGRNDAD